MFTRFFRRYRYHLLFWTVYFLFWTGYSMYSFGTPFLWAWLITSIYFVGHAGTFYTCIYWLIPKFYNTKRYAAFVALLLTIFMAGVIPVAVCLWPVMRHIFEGYTVTFGRTFLYVLLANFYTLFLLVGIKIIREKRQGERKTQLLEKEKTENELRFLKSQINPHFLFNAINSIYILIRKDPEMAAGTLAKFADMLRYQLYECNTDEIPIEKEVAYLDNYIEMEKLRKGNTVTTHYEVGSQVSNFHIAPLLIIPFVENAFKYVSAFSNQHNSVDITLAYKAPVFELQVQNTVDENITVPEDKVYGGIGLENVKRRLELIYNNRYNLQINTTNNKYLVTLSIQTT